MESIVGTMISQISKDLQSGRGAVKKEIRTDVFIGGKSGNFEMKLEFRAKKNSKKYPAPALH